MGFFKNIGKAIKKGVKQISLKNAVKVASSFDPSGIVSGISQAHELKKQAKAEQNALKREALELQAQEMAQNEAIKIGSVTGSLASQVGKTILSETYNGLNGGLKQGAGVVGASVADESIKAWFKKHWVKLTIGVGVIVASIVAWKVFKKPAKRGTRRSW